MVVVEPDKLPSPRKEVGSSPAVTPAARARTPSEPSAARTRSEPSAARDLRSNPAGQPEKVFFFPITLIVRMRRHSERQFVAQILPHGDAQQPHR